MKYIENIQETPALSLLGEPLRDQQGRPVTISMVGYIASLMADPTFTQGMAYATAARRLRQLGDTLAQQRGDAELALEDEAHGRLLKVIEHPSSNVNTQLLAAHARFIDAICAAADKPRDGSV